MQQEGGGHTIAFTGTYRSEEGEELSGLERALQDAAGQATEAGYGGKPFDVVSIQIVPSNPWVSEYRVIIAQH